VNKLNPRVPLPVNPSKLFISLGFSAFSVNRAFEDAFDDAGDPVAEVVVEDAGVISSEKDETEEEEEEAEDDVEERSEEEPLGKQQINCFLCVLYICPPLAYNEYGIFVTLPVGEIRRHHYLSPLRPDLQLGSLPEAAAAAEANYRSSSPP
jgi:hypothetical protein